MQIVSNGDNLHGMSNPVFWEKGTKIYFKMSSAEKFSQSAKRDSTIQYLKKLINYEAIKPI